MADPGHAPRRGGSDAHPPADLRRGVGAAVRQPATVSARSHHEPAPQDRARSGRAADRRHRTGRRLPPRAASLMRGRTLATWVLWMTLLAVATIAMANARGRFDQVHVVLTYLLIVLGASASG